MTKRTEAKKISSIDDIPSELGTPIKQLLPTPESKTSSSRQKEEDEESASDEIQEHTNIEHEFNDPALQHVKRKEMDDDYLQIMEHKVKILKMAGDMAGTPHSVESPLGKEYTFRVSKISSMVTCDRNLKPAHAE